MKYSLNRFRRVKRRPGSGPPEALRLGPPLVAVSMPSIRVALHADTNQRLFYVVADDSGGGVSEVDHLPYGVPIDRQARGIGGSLSSADSRIRLYVDETELDCTIDNSHWLAVVPRDKRISLRLIDGGRAREITVPSFPVMPLRIRLAHRLPLRGLPRHMYEYPTPSQRGPERDPSEQ